MAYTGLSRDQYGVPSKVEDGKGKSGSFPVNTKKRARAALAYIRHAPPSARARIRRLAAKFGVGKGAKKNA